MTKGHSVFQGCITALPTPFLEHDHDRVDFAGLLTLTERQIGGGVDGIAVCGSTGESGSLSVEERLAIFEYTVGLVRGRIPVIAGIGATDTRTVIALAQGADSAGADGLLVTTPPYARPTQAGLVRHFSAVATATSLPISLYNVPSRTAVDLLPDTARKLAAEHPNIEAIKEASASLDRLRVLVEETRLQVLCGEDAWIADAMELGAAGVISVVSNLVPERVAQLVRCFANGKGTPAGAPALVESLAPLLRALAVETNPAPLKAALEMLGLGRGRLRLPLAPIEEANRALVRKALVTAGLL